MKISKKTFEIASVLASAGVLATGMIRQMSPEGSPLTLAIIFSSIVNIGKGLFNICSEMEAEQNLEIEPVPANVIFPLDIEQGNGTHFRDMVTASRSGVRRL